MPASNVSPACIRCRFSARFAPISSGEIIHLRCVRHAPQAKLSKTGTDEIHERFYANFPVVTERMFCGEFEEK